MQHQLKHSHAFLTYTFFIDSKHTVDSVMVLLLYVIERVHYEECMVIRELQCTLHYSFFYSKHCFKDQEKPLFLLKLSLSFFLFQKTPGRYPTWSASTMNPRCPSAQSLAPKRRAPAGCPSNASSAAPTFRSRASRAQSSSMAPSASSAARCSHRRVLTR